MLFTSSFEADLDFTGITDWEPIGRSPNRFSGVFDGDNHKLSNINLTNFTAGNDGVFGATSNATIKNLAVENMVIESTGPYNVGFIGQFTNGGELSNITITNGKSITTGWYAGLIVGNIYADPSAIAEVHNISATGSSDAEDVKSGLGAGGLFGQMFYGNSSNLTADVDVVSTGGKAGGISGVLGGTGTFTRAVSQGTVTTTTEVGGIVGSASVNIYESKSSSTVVSTATSGGANAGGLVGRIIGSYGIYRSVATGSVTAAQYAVGGLLGHTQASNTNTIEDSYSTATVTNTWPSGSTNNFNGTGGLVGYLSGGEIRRSYSSGTVTVQNNGNWIGGLVGILGYWNSNTYAESYIKDSFSVSPLSGAGSKGVSLEALIEEILVLQILMEIHAGTRRRQVQLACVLGNGLAQRGCSNANAISGDATYFFTETNLPLSNWDFSADGPWTINSGVSLPTLKWEGE